MSDEELRFCIRDVIDEQLSDQHYVDYDGIETIMGAVKSRDQQIASERDMWKRRAAKWKKALETSETEHLEECQQIALAARNDLLYDLDEIDNKPWRVFRQLAAIMPEYADIYTEYEAFYAYGGDREVRNLIDEFKKTDDYKESGFPEKIATLKSKQEKGL